MAVRCSVVSLSCNIEEKRERDSVSRVVVEVQRRGKEERRTNERDLSSIRVNDHRSSRVDLGSVDDGLPHESVVVVGDRLGESELSSEDWRNSNLVRLEVDVWRDDRTSSVVDSLSLHGKNRRMARGRWESAREDRGEGREGKREGNRERRDEPSCAS